MFGLARYGGAVWNGFRHLPCLACNLSTLRCMYISLFSKRSFQPSPRSYEICHTPPPHPSPSGLSRSDGGRGLDKENVGTGQNGQFYLWQNLRGKMTEDHGTVTSDFILDESNLFTGKFTHLSSMRKIGQSSFQHLPPRETCVCVSPSSTLAVPQS